MTNMRRRIKDPKRKSDKPTPTRKPKEKKKK
jgi:hypothetical protein